jgi:hypothetical protein
MPLTKSDWTIIHDPEGASPFTLVTTGDWLDDEIGLPWQQQTGRSLPKGAAAARNFGRRAVATTLRINVFKTHSTHAAAREWILECAANTPLHAADLTIAVNGGKTYALSHAVITGGEPRMVPGVGEIRTLAAYNVEGGIFSEVPEEEP